jgi:hypothetical protein
MQGREAFCGGSVNPLQLQIRCTANMLLREQWFIRIKPVRFVVTKMAAAIVEFDGGFDR